MSASSAAVARILQVVREIPPGQVAAYGEVARKAGLPGRARLAARVLAGNADPGLPWHRVVRADGKIAFPPGSASFEEQSRRLRAEGCQVTAGRVRPRVRDLDHAIWGPESGA